MHLSLSLIYRLSIYTYRITGCRLVCIESALPHAGFSTACCTAAPFSLYIWYMGTKNLLGLLLFVTVIAGILYFLDAPAQRDSLLAASASSTKNVNAAEREYSKLLSDIKFGLKQKGVMVKWRDDLLKRLEKLRRSGLSEKKVKEAKALISQLRVGGEGSGPQARSSGSWGKSKTGG